MIDEYIETNKPAIAYSQRFGHYFIIDDKIKIGSDETYTVKDPRWYNTQTLNDSEDLTNEVRDYNNYFNRVNLFSYLETPKPITASIYLYLASPAELLMNDPLGRKLGRDPLTDVTFNEIPDGFYTKEGAIITSDIPLNPEDVHESKVIYISLPIDGQYEIKVIGTDLGPYTLDFLAYNEVGESTNANLTGLTDQGVISTYILNYTSLPEEPIAIERAITIADIIKDVQVSYELGWITKKFVKNILITKLKVAQRLEEQKQRKLEHFDKLIEKVKNLQARKGLEKAKERYEKGINKVISKILGLFIKEVRFFHQKGYINDQAKELLIEDAQYVIRHPKI